MDTVTKSNNTIKTFKFNCPRCGHGTDLKANMTSHLLNKKPCEAKFENLSRETILLQLNPKPKLPQVKCEHCDKIVVKKALKRHLKTCKNFDNSNVDDDNTMQPIDVNIDNLQKTIDEQRQLIQFLTQENQMLKSKLVNVSFNITSNNKVKTNKSKKKNIPHAVKVKCWNTHVGELVPKVNCLCCDNVSITQHNFHCGHIIAETHGGTLDINNLLPICNVCNSSMGSMNMNEFKTMYGFFNT